MTEAEWLSANDLMPMLEFLKGKASDRKLRLWACGCVRRLWEVLVDDRSKRAIEVAEDFVDGRAERKSLRAASKSSERAWMRIRDLRDRYHLSARQEGDKCPAPYSEAQYNAAIAADAAADPSRRRYFERHSPAMAVLAIAASYSGSKDVASRERAVQAKLLRDIFIFPPITLNSFWITSTVLALARQMYDSRDFSPMPILADALQDAGCDNAYILQHCRDSGPHVRGCFVVDKLLGKE